MFYPATLLVAAATAFSGLVAAQNLNYSTTGPLTINVSQVPSLLRQQWCVAQTNSCPEICGGQAFPNTCNQNTLAFTCTCTNGQKPNISDFQQTVPFFICEQWKANCADFHPNDLAGLAGCHSVTCGQKNATSNEKGPTSSSSGSGSSSSNAPSSSSSSGSGSSTASSSASSSPSSSGSAAVMNVAMNHGTSIMAGVMLAVFGLAL